MMDTRVKEKCEMLVESRKLLRKELKFEGSLMTTSTALIYMESGKSVDAKKIKECKKLLKKHEGWTSGLRNNMTSAVTVKMALAEDPESYLERVKNVYELLMKGKVFNSEFLGMAAIAICDQNKDEQTEVIVEKTKELMKLMKKTHPFLTSSEDTAFAAMMAMTGRDSKELVKEADKCFKILHKKFRFHGDGVQSLSHVLACNSAVTEQKCETVMALFDELKAAGVKYGKGLELAGLGVLVDTGKMIPEIVEQVKEADVFLKSQKGFGNFSIGKAMRALIASTVVAESFAEEKGKGVNATLDIALYIAIVTEMMIAVSAATSAAAASSN